MKIGSNGVVDMWLVVLIDVMWMLICDLDLVCEWGVVVKCDVCECFGIEWFVCDWDVVFCDVMM